MNDLDSIILILFGTVAGIFGLLFLMAALEPKKVAPRPQATASRRD